LQRRRYWWIYNISSHEKIESFSGQTTLVAYHEIILADASFFIFIHQAEQEQQGLTLRKMDG
jgi:hypothetical protein